jgi:transposase-like protein
MTDTIETMDLMKLMEHSEESCRTILEKLRWPDGVRCLRCESEKVKPLPARGVYDCYSCGYQFSVLAGTIFHDTHLPLRKWFVAVFLMVESRKGMSANQMKRTISVSYKTAWYLCHRIRAAMKDANPVQLTGVVEADETWVGGKKRGMGRGYTGNKALVLGAIQREGEVRFKVAKRADRKTLHNFISTNVSPDAQAIFTDEWPAYRGIGDANTRHETVNHRLEEWVRADVHTNSVEGVWSLFKRSVVGAYHQLSEKHLQSYLDEGAWRFNNRENPYLFRDTLLKLIHSDSLPYGELTKSTDD